MSTDTALDALVEQTLDHIDDDTDDDLTTGAAAPTQLPPYINAVPVAAMIVDPTYQREPNMRRVDAMVAEFDRTLLGVLEVSDRGDGTFAILDGQHRFLTAKNVDPDMHLVCQVHRGLSVEGEAAVFYDIDVRRKPLSGWDRWKARRGSGDDVVVEIECVVADAGLTVGQALRDGSITATKALETVFLAGGAALLSSTLALLTAAWGNVRDALDGQLLMAVAIVHESYDLGDELDTDRLVAQMQTMPPRQVKARAQALKEVHSAEMPRLCAAVLVERYNAGPGRKVEELLLRSPASGKLLSKQGRRHRELAAIRRWAVRNGFTVGDRGRLSQAVIVAYADAHPGFELATA